MARNGRGGLALLGGYVKNLRAARARDGGAVLLIDAGDMFQGTLESNIGEGAAVVAAYNALGYTAAAIGNHEFDFGPVGKAATPRAPTDDPRGALRARAAEARFPFLAANLIETASGAPPAWTNVRPTTLVDVAGLKVGIVGVMTLEALTATIAGNVGGLSVAPLVDTIRTQATALRAQGADVVIVTAHAGGRCTAVDRPDDLSSCNPDAEILGRRPRAAARAGRRHRGRPHACRDGAPGGRHRHHRGLLERTRLRARRPQHRSADADRRRPAQLSAARSLRARGPGDEGVRTAIRRGARRARVRRRAGRARRRRRAGARPGAGAGPRPQGAADRHRAGDADPPSPAGVAAGQPRDRCLPRGGARRGRRGEQFRRRPARRSAGGAADLRKRVRGDAVRQPAGAPAHHRPAAARRLLGVDPRRDVAASASPAYGSRLDARPARSPWR